MNLATAISLVKKKDVSSFRYIVEQYSSRLLAVARFYAKNTQDAEDILQESYILIFQKIRQFEGDNEHAFLGWMRKIVVNKSLAHYKRNYYTKERYNIEENPTPTINPAIYRTLEEADLMEVIYKLPHKDREIVGLYALEGFSHAEIAKRLKIQESTSRSQYTRAKKKLKLLLQLVEKSENQFIKKSNGI